jgi:hypothetical protein
MLQLTIPNHDWIQRRVANPCLRKPNQKKDLSLLGWLWNSRRIYKYLSNCKKSLTFEMIYRPTRLWNNRFHPFSQWLWTSISSIGFCYPQSLSWREKWCMYYMRDYPSVLLHVLFGDISCWTSVCHLSVLFVVCASLDYITNLRRTYSE